MKNQKSLLGLFLCLSLALQPLHAQQMSGFKKFKQTMAKYAPFQPRDFKAMWTWGNKKFVTKQPLTQTEQQAFDTAKKRTALPAAILAAIIAAAVTYMKFGRAKIPTEKDLQKQELLTKKIVTAIENGNLDEVKSLVEKEGADVNFLRPQMSLLAVAAKEKNMSIVEYLLSKGADPNLKTEYEILPISYAAKDNNIEMAKLLIKKGASFKTDQGLSNSANPVIQTSNPEFVKLLFQNGYKPFETSAFEKAFIRYFEEDQTKDTSRKQIVALFLSPQNFNPTGGATIEAYTERLQNMINWVKTEEEKLQIQKKAKDIGINLEISSSKKE